MVVGVVGADREHLLPGALVEDELEGSSAVLTGGSRDPAELVMAELPYGDAVVG